MAAQRSRYADVNAVVGGYLRDLAFAQSSQQKMFGYKRAAAAILALDVPLTDLAGPHGTLPRIPGIGPGSTRVIREILDNGESPTVEHAIEAIALPGQTFLVGHRHAQAVEGPALARGIEVQGHECATRQSGAEEVEGIGSSGLAADLDRLIEDKRVGAGPNQDLERPFSGHRRIH